MKLFKKIGDFLSRYPRATMFGALFLAVAVFLIICLSKIGAWSVWFDESFSAFMVKQNFADIWHFTALDVNAPLYYFLLKIWSIFVGNSDIALRFLSVIFGIGSLVAGFFLSKKLFGKRVGYFALFFMTLSPMLLRYATEMRCYTMLIFLLIMATYVFVLASEKASRKLWILYGILAAAAMWTHYYAALPILAHLVWRKMTAQKFFTRDFVTSLIVAAALFLPWLPTMITQLGVVQAFGFWIPPFGLDTATSFVGEMMVYSTHDRATNFVALGILGAIILLVILLIKSRRAIAQKLRPNFLLILLLVILPPVVLAILSLPPLRPMFINRYVFFSMTIFSFLVALAVGIKLKLRGFKIAQVVLFIIIVALNIWGLRNILHFGNYNFDTNSISVAKNLMTKIAQNSPQKTIVIAENPWIFYDAVVYETAKNPVYFLDSSTKYEYGSLAMLQKDTTHKILNLAQFAKKGQKIWYISTAKNPVATSKGDAGKPIKTWEKIGELSVKNSFSDDAGFAVEYLVK
jgi:4-amino-4-deoxy-L-arabinose transferase-like glycosyltransferase